MAGCRFIEGDAIDIRVHGDAIYCNQPVVNNGPWCPTHYKLVYVKASAKKPRELDEGSG
jgi:hypothetical protein